MSTTMSLTIGLTMGSSGRGGGTAETASTWNPADKNAAYTLSPSKLTATCAVAPGQVALRSTLPRTGKRYCEQVVVLNASDSSPSFANSTASLNAYLGIDTNGVCLYGANGQVLYNGVSLLATGTPLAAAEVVGWAYDIPNALLWVYRGGVLQNGNPVAGTGGLSVPGIGASPFMGFWCGFAPAETTLRATAASFTGTIPTGFVAWDPA